MSGLGFKYSAEEIDKIFFSFDEFCFVPAWILKVLSYNFIGQLLVIE